MTVKILLPTFDNYRILDRTLNSISKCRAPEDLCEIVVIENRKKGKTEELVAKYKNGSFIPIVYCYSECAGKSAALNDYIFKHVDDEVFLIFTDDDIRFNENWVTSFVKAAQKNGGQYFYGGSFFVDYERRPDRRLLRYFPESARGINDDDFKRKKKMIFFGFNWAAYAKDIKSIGGFDVNFGPGSLTGATGQETTAQIQLINSGLTPFLVENNYVWHWIPQEKSDLKWLKERYRRNGVSLRLQKQYLCFFSHFIRRQVLGFLSREVCILNLEALMGFLTKTV